MTTRPQRGFTLIELITVIIVTAIVSVIAIPSARRLGDLRVRACANALQRDLTYARERAMASGRRCWVSFTTGTNALYTLSEEPLGGTGLASASVITDPATGKNFLTYLNQGDYAGVSIASVSIVAPDTTTSTSLGFDRLGRPVSGTGPQILTAAATVSIGGVWTVRIQPGTGAVDVY